MSAEERAADINFRIRRNLGVFNVPLFNHESGFTAPMLLQLARKVTRTAPLALPNEDRYRMTRRVEREC